MGMAQISRAAVTQVLVFGSICEPPGGGLQHWALALGADALAARRGGKAPTSARRALGPCHVRGSRWVPCSPWVRGL